MLTMIIIIIAVILMKKKRIIIINYYNGHILIVVFNDLNYCRSGYEMTLKQILNTIHNDTQKK